MILKVDFDGDMRRINMTLSEDAPASQKFKDIRLAVAQGFDMEESMLPGLKYKDEEGDVCTLVEASVEDLLELSNSGTIRLLASSMPAAATTEDTEHRGPTPSSDMHTQADADAATSPLPAAATNIESSAHEAAKGDNAASAVEDAGHEAADTVPTGEEEPATACQGNTEPQEEKKDTEAVDALTAMGFSEDQAKHALECAKGSMEAAVDFLVNGLHQQEPAPKRSPRERLESKIRSLPNNVIEQLQRVRSQLHQIAAKVKQHKTHVQEETHGDEADQFKDFETTLKAMQARLREFRDLVQAALKTPANAAEEESFRQVEAQFADAHRFVSETLATLHTEAAAAGGVPVAMETMDAVVNAAVDGALVAMATVEEILFGNSDPAACSALEAATSAEADSTTASASSSAAKSGKSATKMDHAQVFLSKSISALRAQASGLMRGGRTTPSPRLQSAHAAGAGSATHGYSQPTEAVAADDAFLLAPSAETTCEKDA